ncbi:RNA polymerase sigma factor [Paraflavitalea soli]|uniref:RNA polymerase sigma factor n=1 Tax=Paraflavitalea soli TaxID=2315862 RepID=UPI0013C42410|nr:RNA polymerase sigma-70 factor [Paraflavitalea soli]
MPFVQPYNEQELLLRIAAGDQEAYRQIFESYWDKVYGIGLRLTKSPELAKDLAQETFIKIWNNRDKLPAVTNFSAFIFTVSRHLVIDHLRKHVFTASNEDYLTAYFSDDAISPQEKTEYKELEKLMHRAIDNLPPQLQQVFRLSRIEGLTHAEIALRMNITRITSKSYMVRALYAIRKYLAQYNNDQLLVMLVAGELVKIYFRAHALPLLSYASL